MIRRLARSITTLAGVSAICVALLVYFGALPPVTSGPASAGEILRAWVLVLCLALIGAALSKSPIITGSLLAMAVVGVALIGSST